jgi:hypothetical protein
VVPAKAVPGRDLFMVLGPHFYIPLTERPEIVPDALGEDLIHGRKIDETRTYCYGLSRTSPPFCLDVARPRPKLVSWLELLGPQGHASSTVQSKPKLKT